MITRDFKQRMLSMLELDSDPRHVAAGFAIGVFISVSPFIGIQTFIAIVSALVFKLNKLTTITGSLVNTPFTMLPLLMVNYRLGEFVLGQKHKEVSFDVLDWEHLHEYTAPLFVGCSITGLAAAAVSYVLVYRLAARLQRQGMQPEAVSGVAEPVDDEPQDRQP